MKSIYRLVALLGGVLLLSFCAPQPTTTPGLPPTKFAIGLPTQVGATTRPTTTIGTVTQPPPGPSLTNLRNGSASPLPTARAHLYDDVDEPQILAAVFPNLTLNQGTNGYEVQGSKDWVVWVNDRDEGHITQAGHEELVTAIANQVGANPPKEEAPYGPSSIFLAVLERQGGKLVMTQRQQPFGSVSPANVDVRVERILDVDNDGQDEILITTSQVQSQIARTDAYLYRWSGDRFVELWKGLEENDNTAASNQPNYSVYEATVNFSDLEHSGVDAIIVDASTTSYPKDSQGAVDLSAPTTVTTERTVYKWDGKAFVVDSTSSTPPVLEPSATP